MILSDELSSTESFVSRPIMRNSVLEALRGRRFADKLRSDLRLQGRRNERRRRESLNGSYTSKRKREGKDRDRGGDGLGAGGCCSKVLGG